MRFWARWKTAGAVKEYPKDYESQLTYRDLLQREGGLTGSEITELVRFETVRGPVTVDQQVRRYYLRVKSNHPIAAEKMRIGVSPILQKGIKDLIELENLCRVVYQYWSSFFICYNGESYTVTNNVFKRV